MKKLLFGLIGVAGLAASASATTTWTTQIRYQAFDAAFNPIGVGNSFNVTTTGVYNFVMQVGIFNFSDTDPTHANHGLNNWSGRATSTGLNTGAGEALQIDPNFSRQGVYNFGPATSFGGFVTGGGTGIDGSSTPGSFVQAARAIAPTETIPWPLPVGSPAPTGPTEYGVNDYTDVLFFSVNVASTSGNNIVVTWNGQAGPIVAWQPFTQVPPSDPPGPPPPVAGSINFLGLTPNPVLQSYAASTLTLVRVPAPGAMALLGLGGLVATRRRRS